MAERETRSPEPAAKPAPGIFDRGREPAPDPRATSPAGATGPDAARIAEALRLLGAGGSATPQSVPRDPPHPYIGPTEIIRGGAYIRGAKLQGDRHYGGEIVDAEGRVLATFDDRQENTGNPRDGRKPDSEGNE